MVVRVMVTMRFWLGDLRFGVATSACRGDSTGEVHSLNLQDENPRSDLNWLCLAVTLLKALLCEHELPPR
jgi:hypothetical protein